MNFKITMAGFLLMICAYLSHASDLASPLFENAAEEQTNSGYIKLSWFLPADARQLENTQLELQQADNEAFENPKVIYRGEDFATFLSGQLSGDLYLHVRKKFLTGYHNDTNPVSLERKDALLNHILGLHILHDEFVGNKVNAKMEAA